MDLFASGTDIYTTSSKDDEYYNPFPGPNAYTFESGTSLAAPLVAGTAVLMASATGNQLSGAKLKSLLRKSVDKLPALQDLCISGVSVSCLTLLLGVAAAWELTIGLLCRSGSLPKGAGTCVMWLAESNANYRCKQGHDPSC